MDWTLVSWPRLTAMGLGMAVLAPLAHWVDYRLRPALSRLGVDEERAPQLRRLARTALLVVVILLAMWGAGLTLTQPLFWLGEHPVSLARLGLFLAGLALAETGSRLLHHVVETRAVWLEPKHRPAVAELMRWGLLVVLGLSLLGWLGFNVRNPLVTVSDRGISLFQIGLFAIYVAGVLIGSRVLGSTVDRRLLARTRLDAGVRYAIGRMCYYTVMVVGLMTSLDLLGLQLGSLTVLLGAVGVGIGFGLQNIVNNFVSGLMLLVERPIKLGDMVEIDGVRGTVSQIGGRSTTVRTGDNVAIVVPNADLISHKLTNWSQGDPGACLHVPLRVDSSTDVEHLRDGLVQIATGHEKVLRQPEPRVNLKKFDETGTDLELLVWFDTLRTRPNGLISDLNYAIFKFFRDHDIQLPKAQLELMLNGRAVSAAGTSPL